MSAATAMPGPKRARQARLRVALLLAAVAAAHMSGLMTGFLSDDFMILGHLDRSSVTGELTRPFLDLEGVLFYRPLLTGSYALDRFVWGLNPFGFHMTNLLLHMLVTLLVFEVARALSGRWLAGWLAAALIGFHPLNPNTVTWIAGRVSLLGAVFPLLAIAAFLAHRRRSRPGMEAVVIAATIAGYFAKESSMAVPLFLLIVDRLLAGRRVGGRLHATLWATLALYLIARCAVLGVVLGGYGAAANFSFGSELIALGGSFVDALTPFTKAGWLEGSTVATVFGVMLWVGATVAWVRGGYGRRGRGRFGDGGRGALVAAGWAGGMVLSFAVSGWTLELENAERWYPALTGFAILLGIIAAGAGRVGFVVAAVSIVVGLPALAAGERQYRAAGATARRVIEQVRIAPRPVFVLNLPITLHGAPFLHFGLADACRPPFAAGPAKVEVFAVHSPHATIDAHPNPAPWLAARAGAAVSVVWLNERADSSPPLDRTTILDYAGFAPFAALPEPNMTTPAQWGTRLDVALEGTPGDTVAWYVFAPIAGQKGTGVFDAAGRWSEDLATALVDHLRYPGTERVFLVVLTRGADGKLNGCAGRWIAAPPDG